MDTLLIVIVICAALIALLSVVLFAIKSKASGNKNAAINAGPPVQTPPQATPPTDGVLTNLKKGIGGIRKKDSFFPVLLALGVVGAIWFMGSGLPWLNSLFKDNSDGRWVLLAALIIATIVYPKKAVPALLALLLISLGFYFGPKVVVAYEGPKAPTVKSAGFFDGTLPLKANEWSETIFIKGGFEISCMTAGIIYSLEINGTKEVQWDGNNRLLPPNEDIIRIMSLRIKSPIDTKMILTQLTK